MDTPAAAAAPAVDVAPLEHRAKSGANWFYWIAALSLVNTIAAFTGSQWRFIIGLGITQVVDTILTEVVKDGGNLARGVALALDLIVAGIFITFGVFAGRRHTWAFIVGLVLFALDTVIFIIAQDWLGIAFHAYVCYCLFVGLKAARQLNQLPPPPADVAPH